MRRMVIAALAVLVPALAAARGAERLYVLDCGWARIADQSRFSPGVNVGVPLDISDNCYLIRHPAGWLLWDTGYPDALAARPDGERSADGFFHRHRPKTLSSQLAEIGVKPSDVRFVAISHTHPDHVGNVELFPDATVLIERAEYDWAFAQKEKPFSADHRVEKLEGDKDVFGDGSVTILSTPGHKPGHAALLVSLPRAGWIVLSGDAAHTRSNWDARRVPERNVDREQSLSSMRRIADVVAERHAQLWINHDKPQSDRLRHAPAFYE